MERIGKFPIFYIINKNPEIYIIVGTDIGFCCFISFYPCRKTIKYTWNSLGYKPKRENKPLTRNGDRSAE